LFKVEVIRANTAGYCMGVIMALRKLDTLIEEGLKGGPIFTLGPIIHNPQVLEEYTHRGVTIAESPEAIPSGATVVIRAHGVPKTVLVNIRRRGLLVVDATCPKVKKAQLLIEEQAKGGRLLLLYGEKGHPEVNGLLSYADAGAFLFDAKEKLDAFPLEIGQPYCLAAQTTQDREVFNAIVEGLAMHQKYDVVILQTICDATKDKQEEAVRITREVDLMIVVGGYSSGNTRRLVQIVAAQSTPVLHVETAKELSLEKLKKFSRVGLIAGASTPKKMIDEIHHILKTLPGA
jgi:4-hydroxy-3-methylbut-2-enyl diphosphate reductase